MSNSVILQVDESTKGLMEEIQSGISSSIEDGMRDVKEKVGAVDDNTEMLLEKFNKFDGLSSSVEQLRLLAEESKKFTSIVSPLENSVYEIKKVSMTQEQMLDQVASNVSLIIKEVEELGGKEDEFSSNFKINIQNVLGGIENVDKGTRTLLNDIVQKILQERRERQEAYDRLCSSLTSIKELIGNLSSHFDEELTKIENGIYSVISNQCDFSKKYDEIESLHQVFESRVSSHMEEVNNSLEKVQTTLDIIVNLVTPFWKKWRR